MDRFEAMKVFCSVVEQGGFAAAATRLDVSTSVVSRQVAQLESLLNARLLNRTTRRLSLTENGRAYYERCIQLLADLEEAEESLGSNAASPRGTLRVTAPISFGVSHLARAIGEYSQRHPGVGFDISLSDRVVDLVEEGLDLAIRIGNTGSQNVVARPIGHAHEFLCASDDYLARCGTPQSPLDLAEHNCLIYAYATDNTSWTFCQDGKAPLKVAVTGRLHANNGTLLGELAAQGMGITRAPDFILDPLLRQGRLRLLLNDWQLPPLSIYAVYPSRRHLSAKVRSFVNFLEGWLKQHRN